MKTISLFKFILLFATICSYGQISQPYSLTLSNDTFNFEHIDDDEIIISCEQNVQLSGYFESENSVVVRPLAGASITFLPTDLSFSDTSERGTGGASGVKSGGRGGPPIGRMAATQTDTKGIAIYPNPVQSNLTFQLENEEVILYEIYDLNSILKLTQSLESTSKSTIDVSNLNSGNYILKLKTQKNQYITVQFLKK